MTIIEYDNNQYNPYPKTISSPQIDFSLISLNGNFIHYKKHCAG